MNKPVVSAKRRLLTKFLPANRTSTEARLALNIADPAMDWQTYTPRFIQPIYAGDRGNKELGWGALPAKFTVRNTSAQPLSAVQGTILVQMLDLGFDIPSAGGANGTRINTTDVDFNIKETGKDALGAGTYSWVYQRDLAAGESAAINLRYFVNYPFANVNYELLLIVTAQAAGGGQVSAARMGSVKGFARYR